MRKLEEIDRMTDDEKEAAIATALGWERRKTKPIDGEEIPFWYNKDDSKYYKGDVPDYLGDINAMRKEIMNLDSDKERRDFMECLGKVAHEDFGISATPFQFLTSSASQWARAFLMMKI